MKFPRVKQPRTIVAGTIIMAAAYVLSAVGCFINYHVSMPKGLYREVPFDGTLQRGELVIVDVPQEMHPFIYGRHWAPDGFPLFKTVGAVAGDEYQVTDAAIFINSQFYGPVFAEDSQKLPMPRLCGTFRVAEGYFVPLSNHIPNSFDGRYFGQVPFSAIHYKVIPIIVFK